MTNPLSLYRLEMINIYKEWRPEPSGWSQYRIFCYSDDSASSKIIEGPISKKEYFKRKLDGTS